MWKNIEFIKNIIKESSNKSDVLKKLNLKNNGGNFNSLTRFIKINDIDISHFVYTKRAFTRNRVSMSDILVLNSKFASTSHLKKRLYKEGLKERKCELCGQDESWYGKKMSLIIDHINGDRYDNRLENLRIVCPNCNATLDTHCRGLNVNKEPYNSKVKNCEGIGCFTKIRNINKFCIECYRKNKSASKPDRKELRKIKRPSYQQLIQEVQEIGYSAVGRKYLVSDNSVRKWIKMYEKYGENY